MNYEQTLDYLFNRFQSFHNEGAKAYKPGLEKAYRLSEAFGNPHKDIRCIHIGGTNGKGSTAHSIASVMMAAGLKTGLYTSPHLVDFTERIRIDGKPIPQNEVVDFVRQFTGKNLQDLDPSFFELTTIMAFEYFAREKVDIAIIEVGLGGLLDTTNIITPELSVITNVSFDHTSLLGKTLPEIAGQKAGIIKPGVPVVIGRRNPLTDSVFTEKSDLVKFADDNPGYVSYEQSEDHIIYRGTLWGDIRSCLTGDCQPENMATILNALEVLQARGVVHLTPETVAKGLRDVCATTGLTGRWTKLSENPEIIIDTAHNPDGWKFIASKLAKKNPEKIFFVIGFASDKDFGEILSGLPREARYFFVTPSVKRAAPAEKVAETAARYGIFGKAFPSVATGFEAAYNEALSEIDSTVFVGGSNFVVADFLKEEADFLKEVNYEK